MKNKRTRYVYEIIVYDTLSDHPCAEHFGTYFMLDDAKFVVENNVTDIHEGVYDTVKICKYEAGLHYSFALKEYTYVWDRGKHCYVSKINS